MFETSMKSPPLANKRILLATDGSRFATECVRCVCRIVWPPNTTIYIVTVVDMESPATKTSAWQETHGIMNWGKTLINDFDALQIEARQIAALAARALTRSLPHVMIEERITVGEPGIKLLESIQDIDPSLIAVGARRTTLSLTMGFGGVTDILIRDGLGSLLIVRQACESVDLILIGSRGFLCDHIPRRIAEIVPLAENATVYFAPTNADSVGIVAEAMRIGALPDSVLSS